MYNKIFKCRFVALLFIIALLCNFASAGGVTIITHGYNPSISGTPAWLNYMRDDIASEWLNNDQNYATITVTGSVGSLTATCSPWNVGLSTSDSGEIIVVLDWSAVADHLVDRVPAQDVATVVVPKITQGQNGEKALAELPIHLIGHSRGGGMVCEIARLLGEEGVIVDHLTPLDPHPLTSSDPQLGAPYPDIIDTPAAIYENIVFADNYLQRISYPEGEILSGAYNREWTSIPGGYHDNTSPGNTYADHRNVPLAYAATVNLASPLYNGEATLQGTDRTSWFTTYETDGGVAGQKTGFYYSLIAGNNDRLSTDQPNGNQRPVDGYHNDSLLGGSGSRTSLTWGSAVWPNLATLKVYRSSTLLGSGIIPVTIGESLDIQYVGFDADSTCDVTFYVDQDRNPYNSNNIATIGTQNHTAGSSSFFNGSQTWDTTGLTGTFYVYGAMTDGTRTRYLYATPEFQEQSSVSDWMMY